MTAEDPAAAVRHHPPEASAGGPPNITDPLLRPAAAWVTDVGNVRQANEDNLLVDERLGLFAVADGMGGRNAGEIASQIAVDAVGREMAKARESISRVRFGEERPELARDILARAVQLACAEVHEHAKKNRDTRGMGCTLTCLLTVGQHALMAHVGDSRLYLLRDGKLHQLSTDHTMAAELMRAGTLTLEKAKMHRWGHVLTRSIGTQASVPVETLLLPVIARDRFLICSDGLYTDLSDDEIQQMLMLHAPSESPQKMVERVLERRAGDNTTCVVVEIAGDPGAAAEARHAADAQAVLRRSFLCEGLGVRELARVFSFCDITVLPPGQVLLEQGEQLEQIIFVVHGRIIGERNGEPVGEIVDGDFLGETTLIRGRPVRGTLKAAEATVVLELRASGLRKLRQRHPELGAHLMAGLALRLSRELDRANWRLESLDDPHQQGADDPSVL